MVQAALLGIGLGQKGWTSLQEPGRMKLEKVHVQALPNLFLRNGHLCIPTVKESLEAIFRFFHFIWSCFASVRTLGTHWSSSILVCRNKIWEMFDTGGEGLSYCNESCIDEKVLLKDMTFESIGNCYNNSLWQGLIQMRFMYSLSSKGCFPCAIHISRAK